MAGLDGHARARLFCRALFCRSTCRGQRAARRMRSRGLSTHLGLASWHCRREFDAMSTEFVNRVAVEIDGQGDAAVCIHGLGDRRTTGRPSAGALACFRALRIDLPGSATIARRNGGCSASTSPTRSRLSEAVELDLVDRRAVDRRPEAPAGPHRADRRQERVPQGHPQLCRREPPDVRRPSWTRPSTSPSRPATRRRLSFADDDAVDVRPSAANGSEGRPSKPVKVKSERARRVRARPRRRGGRGASRRAPTLPTRR